MAKQVKRRRGTTAQHSAFTGAEAEVTVDTDKETLVVHDNATAGGFPLLREDMANVTPATGRTALGLGTAAVLDTGTAAGEAPTNADLNEGAFLDAGSVAGELITLDGSGRIPAGVDGSLLENLAETSDVITNRNNAALNTITAMDNHNLAVQVVINGMADSFIDQSGVDTVTSTNEVYDGTAGDEHYNNGTVGAGTSMVLESADFAPSITSATGTLVIIEENIDQFVTLNVDLIAEISRDGGTTFTAVTLSDGGPFVFGSTAKRILTSDAADLSGQGTSTAMIWRVRTPTSQAVKIYSVAMHWRA